MFFYSYLSTLGQLNAQFGNSHKQLVMEKFNITEVLRQSPTHKQNVSIAPLQLGSTHCPSLLCFDCLHLTIFFFYLPYLTSLLKACYPTILFVEDPDSLQCHGSQSPSTFSLWPTTTGKKRTRIFLLPLSLLS